MVGYLEEIKNERLEEIVEIQNELVLDYRVKQGNHGKFYKNSKENKEEFFRKIFRTTLIEDKRRTFLVSKDFNKQYKCESLDSFLENMRKFRFFCPSVFWHHKLRTKEELIWINTIVLDFDFSKDNSNRNYSAQEVALILHKEFAYDPNYIWETRTPGNWQACYLIEPMTGTEKSIYLFEAIAKRMAILVGADVTAVSATNLYTIPKRGYWKFSADVLDIDEFKYVLDDKTINNKLIEKGKEKIISLTEKQLLKQDAIKCLLNAEFDSYRNHAAFTIALLFYALDKTSDEAYEFLSGEWFEKVNDSRFSSRFLKREVKDCVKSAFSGKYSGPAKAWVELITGMEFNFNIYKSTYKKKSLADGGYRSANEVQLKILKWLEDNDEKRFIAKDVYETLNIPRRSFIRNVQALESSGYVEYVVKKGRNGYSMMKDLRNEGSPFIVENNTIFNENDIIEYFPKKTSV